MSQISRPNARLAQLVMALAIILPWPAPAAAALSERGGTGVWEVQSAESHRPARLELGFYSTYQRLGLRDSADTQINELIGGASAVFGVPGGFELSGAVPFYNDYASSGSGAAPDDSELAPKLGDFAARLRWTGPFLLPGLRWGLEGEAVFATGNNRTTTYPGRAPTRLFTARENSYAGRGMMTWDGLRAGSGAPLRLHVNAGYTLQGDNSRYLLPQTPLPLEVPAPSRNRDNDYLTLGAAVEIDLPRMTLFGEVVTNQFVYERVAIKGEESRVVVTPGVRFWLPGGVSIGGAWSFNVSDDDPATAFDPGRAFPKYQWRLALSLGTVYRGASAKAEDLLAIREPVLIVPPPAAPTPAAATAVAAPVDTMAAMRDSLATVKKRQQRDILERRAVQEAPAVPDGTPAAPLAKPPAHAAPTDGVAVPPAGAGPFVDTDRDGIPDASDRCPLQSEDWDGFQDFDGCPDLDNDQDGIPDVRDLCPNDPETYNGYYDFDGCPDAVQRRWIGDAVDMAAPAPHAVVAPDSARLAMAARDTSARARVTGPAAPVRSDGVPAAAPPRDAAADSLRTALALEQARTAWLEAQARQAEAERLAWLERTAPAPDSSTLLEQERIADRLRALEARQALFERGPAATDSALARASAGELRRMILADRQRQAETTARLQALEARQQMLVDRPGVATSPAPAGATTVVTPRTDGTAELAARIAVLEARLASRGETGTPPAGATPTETVAVTAPPASASPEIMEKLRAIEDSIAALSNETATTPREPATDPSQALALANLDVLLPVGLTRVFPEIVFSTRSARLDAAGAARVNTLAAGLRDVPAALVRIIGHSDDRGPASVNQQLSRSRAATVADLMFAQGVTRDQIIVDGRGESDPLADNATVEGRRVNRRVEFLRIR